MKCKTCEYFKCHGTSVGECRKSKPISNQATNEALWPLVKLSDWCGDYVRSDRDFFKTVK